MRLKLTHLHCFYLTKVDTGPVAEGYPDCSRQGNDRLTCVHETQGR